MKLGFFTAILPDLSFEQVLQFAARNNFSCVEVACWPAGKAERKFAGITHIDVAVPALSLVRIDSFARRHGLTHGALFVEAVDRWAMQETVPRDRRGGMSDSPTLFDFANPLEVRVETIARPINAPSPSAGHEPTGEGTNVEGNIDDITAELVRLLEGSGEPRPVEETADDRRNRAAAKPE